MSDLRWYWGTDTSADVQRFWMWLILSDFGVKLSVNESVCSQLITGTCSLSQKEDEENTTTALFPWDVQLSVALSFCGLVRGPPSGLIDSQAKWTGRSPPGPLRTSQPEPLLPLDKVIKHNVSYVSLKCPITYIWASPDAKY